MKHCKMAYRIGIVRKRTGATDTTEDRIHVVVSQVTEWKGAPRTHIVTSTVQNVGSGVLVKRLASQSRKLKSAQMRR